MSQYEKGQQVWFQKRPKNENSKPDAIYSRSMGDIHGKPVVEVMKGGQPWICGLHEIAHPKTALIHIAGQWATHIKGHHQPDMKKKELAKLCGVSTGTLRNRIAVCLRLKLLLEDPTAKKEKTK